MWRRPLLLLVGEHAHPVLTPSRNYARCLSALPAGAYYSYTTEPGKNYQQTVLDVNAYLQSINLPVQSLQFDSWWYYQRPSVRGPTAVVGVRAEEVVLHRATYYQAALHGPTSHRPPPPRPVQDGALMLWEPMPSVFPSGMNKWQPMPLTVRSAARGAVATDASSVESTARAHSSHLPLVSLHPHSSSPQLHNRYFANNNNYTAMPQFRNSFLEDGNSPVVVPVDKALFKYIMAKGAAWGARVYEQDWCVRASVQEVITERW